MRNVAGFMIVVAACTVLGAASGTGGLSIATDPDSASVFVDGRPAGTTPLHLSDIAAGEHRIRIVKSGYLENARMVTVSPGAPHTLQVKLTRAGETAAGGQVVSTTGAGGGGSSKKWLYIAAAGGGAAAAGLGLANRNHAPTAGTAAVTPSGTGLAAVTSFAFASQGATDSDGDSLTLTWNFGDGGATATGANVNHVFQNAGTFNVNVTVSDGKAEAKSADVQVTVRNVNGTWSGTQGGILRTWTFSQTGTTINGTYSRNAGGVVTPGTVAATLTPARSIAGTATSTGFTPFTFEGSFDSAVSTLTVVANGSGFVGDTLIFTRQ
jgi:hypothetical protein